MFEAYDLNLIKGLKQIGFSQTIEFNQFYSGHKIRQLAELKPIKDFNPFRDE